MKNCLEPMDKSSKSKNILTINKQFEMVLPFFTIIQPMRKVILYIAVSLDGYIADSEDSVEWMS